MGKGLPTLSSDVIPWLVSKGLGHTWWYLGATPGSVLEITPGSALGTYSAEDQTKVGCVHSI